MKAKELIAHLSANPEAEVYFHNMKQFGSSWLPVDWVDVYEGLIIGVFGANVKNGDFVIGCD